MFNIEEFDIKLDTEFIGRNFIYCEEIESTNDFLLKSDIYNKNGTVLLAEFQSQGRGRRSREWISIAEQNLTFSILLTFNVNPRNINIIGLGASLAVAYSIENLYQLDVSLKWPNDVLIQGKKVSGILLESSSTSNKIEKTVVGFGINVNQPNFIGKFIIPPSSIRREFKKIVNREKLLSEVLNNFETVFELVVNDAPKMLNDWRSRCKMIGEKVKIEDDKAAKFGIFDDIDENGFLILKRGEEYETIHFGDASLRQ